MELSLPVYPNPLHFSKSRLPKMRNGSSDSENTGSYRQKPPRIICFKRRKSPMAQIFPGHSFTSPLRGDGGNPQSSGMSPHPANLHASSAGAGKVHPHPYKEDGYNQTADWRQSRSSRILCPAPWPRREASTAKYSRYTNFSRRHVTSIATTRPSPFKNTS